MNLMRCLREMRAHQPTGKQRVASGGVVPLRESKLTHLFMNHLTGPAASRTSMIVNVNPAADNYDETQHVLGYAATARSVIVSEVDYNRRWRLQAKEEGGVGKLARAKGRAPPPKKRSLIANVVQKASPKKRKGMAVSSPLNPHTKRLRSNSGQVGAPHNGRKFPPRWRRHRKEARPAPKGSHAGPQDSCLHKEEQ